MAVENKKSSIVSGLDADPATRENSDVFEGRIQEQVQFLSVAAADDDGSVLRYFRVPSNARLGSLQQKNDAITLGSDYDWGVYQTLKNGGAVVDANALATAIDNTSARASWTEVGQVAEADSEKPLWALLGLTEDPNIEYDICATANTIGTSIGDIAAKLQYAI